MTRDELVEVMARAVFDAPNGLDGDSIATMICENVRVQVIDGDKGITDTMTVCRAAARAALEAAEQAGWALVPREPTDDDAVRVAREMVDGYWHKREPRLSETPALLSILYDIDLLPEQIRRPGNAARMIAFCEVFRRLTPEAVADLFSGSSAAQEG